MLCVDASVVVKRLLSEPYSEQVIALLATTVRRGQAISAPSLLPMEVANALRKQVVRGIMPATDAATLLASFDRLPISILPRPGQHHSALQLAEQFGLPAVYDACYLVLAQSLGCDFWTDDRTLLRTLGGRLPFVRWIGDVVVPSDPSSQS